MHVGEKKSILFRWEAVLAAFLLILSMAVTLMPVNTASAAVNSVEIDSSNNKIEYGSDFGFNIYIAGDIPGNVTVEGKGGLSGSYGGKLSSGILNIPRGIMSFDGKSQPYLAISYTVSGEQEARNETYYFTKDKFTFTGNEPLGNRINVSSSYSTASFYFGQRDATFTIPFTVNSVKEAQVSITLPTGLTAASYSQPMSISGSNGSVTFKISASDDLATTTTTVGLTITYYYGNEKVTEEATVSVKLYGKGEQTSSEEPSAPALIGNQITVSKNAFMPEIKAGESKDIMIPLNATSVVGSAQVTLTMPDGLYLESAAATQTVNFKKGSASISCRVTAKQDVTDSVVPITVESAFSYDGQQVKETTTFSVRLRASDDIKSNGKLVITGYQLGSSTLSYNGDTSLTITVQNTGSATMKDITMTLDGMATGSVTLKSGMDVQTLVELGPGQQSTFTYQLHGDKALPSGTAILTATAACGEEKSVAKVFVPCVGKPETSGGEGESGPGSSKPQVIIESYTYGEEGTSVTGGSTFTLGMTLKNTSSSSAIENIKMVVSSAADETTGGVFTPASSSNSFFIAKVGAGESFTESIDLTVKADAPPKSYGIDVQIAYEAVVDGKRESLTATERITIPVSQPDRFEVEDAQISSTVYAGESTSCSVSYVNKGKSAIYNLSIAVEGTGFTTADSNTYVGNVEAGNGDYFETTLNVTEPGTIDGKFIITYEDSAGTQTTLERPFTATVMEMDWGEPDPMEPTEPVDANPGLPLWGKILIIVGCVVVAGGIVVVVLRIRRKKRKAVPVFDDEDDDDYGDDDFDE